MSGEDPGGVEREGGAETTPDDADTARPDDAAGGLFGGISRREALTLAGAGSLLAATTAVGVDVLFGGPRRVATSPTSDARAEALAVEFAPDLYFGAHERWFPTDPRRYASERDGETVVDGFDALDGYTTDAADAEAPPAPTAFYNAVTYQDTPLSVVQFWFYYAFDQFATNFHWHDWEVLHVFVDTSGEADTPVLYVASAHSRRVHNNEYLDPDPEVRPGVISEVGSHSSAVGVNQRRETFQRFSFGSLSADITNSALEALRADLPAAYGLPRDEGFRLAYLVPELDGAPLPEHDRLPNVALDDVIHGDLVVRDLASLAAPPETLPLREHATALTLDGEARVDSDTHATYELHPIDVVRDIDAFTGPQLSFEFAVPAFAEDAIASHITTVGVPWEQPRFEHPMADITDPRHAGALADRYEALSPSDPSATATATDTIVGSVTRVVERADGGGMTTRSASVEAVCLLESEDPTAVPTWNGVLALRGPAREDHRLTVNAPGFAPYAQRLGFDGGQRPVGADGDVALVANEDAAKLRTDARDQPSSVARVRVLDEVAGALYDAPPDGDRFGIYVHRGGTYTAELTDERGELGAFRIDPTTDADPETTADRVTIENPRTGKASLASFLVAYLGETTLLGRDIAIAAGIDPDDLPRPEDIPDPNAPLDTVEAVDSGKAMEGVTNTTEEATNATGEATNTTEETTNATSDVRTDSTVDADATGATETTGTPIGDDPDGSSSTSETNGPSSRPAVAALDGLAGAARAARRALGAAEAGDTAVANRELRAIRGQLEATDAAAESGRLPPDLDALLGRRLPRFRTRVRQAIDAAG